MSAAFKIDKELEEAIAKAIKPMRRQQLKTDVITNCQFCMSGCSGGCTGAACGYRCGGQCAFGCGGDNTGACFT